MRTLLLCCVVLCSVSMQAQVEVSPLKLRILNGHSGKPVKRANLTVTVTPAQTYGTPLDRRTDNAGVSSLLAQTGTEIHTVVLRYPTCRAVPKADRKKPSTGYPTQRILVTGIVSENHCSKRTTAPAPGELVLFVRPQHWWERMSY